MKGEKKGKHVLNHIPHDSRSTWYLDPNFKSANQSEAWQEKYLCLPAETFAFLSEALELLYNW